MVKKYITTLKNGAHEQKAFILGRSVTLVDGEIVSEGILTKTFPSLFEEIYDVEPNKEWGAEAADDFTEEVSQTANDAKPEELLVDESSNVSGEVTEEPAEAAPKKARATKATKAK